MHQTPALSRAEIAQNIIQQPDAYKICECCDSIIVANVALCPNCHGYRFDGDHARIIEQAKILGAREQTSVTAEDLA